MLINLKSHGIFRSNVAFLLLIDGEPKLGIVQKHTFFAPERYTAGILYTDSLKSTQYKTTV